VAENKWIVGAVDARDSVITVTALGPSPNADISNLRKAMKDDGLSAADLSVNLVVGGSGFCPANGDVCQSIA
jgi:hypothetical protein